MPELPEVETIRRGLVSAFEGKTIRKLVQKRPDLRFPFPANFSRRLSGRTVLRLARRAKYLLVHLDQDETLLVHLGMSGRFTIGGSSGDRKIPGVMALKGSRAAPDGTGRHDHIVFHMVDGCMVIYSDHRRFGYMDLVKTSRLDQYKPLASLGPEPLSRAFSATSLNKALRGRRAPLKSVLLNQRIVAGLGNIYVCEALYRSGLSPLRQAASISRACAPPSERIRRLTRAVRDVLREAIRAGGSSLQDYVHTDGTSGYFQHHFQVYGREGEPCSRAGCSGKVRRIIQSGRSTFFCPACQR